MGEHCIHEKDFGEMKIQIKAMEKVLFDNGTPGLQTQVIRLNANLETKIIADRESIELRQKSDQELKESLEALRKAVGGLSEFKKEVETLTATEDRLEVTKRWRLGLWMTSIFAFLGLVMTVLNFISKIPN